MTELPSIPEFYANKSILITGGSGFLGKVLVEKLLRSCPDLKKIYLLMRPKKNKSGKDRIGDITDLPLFDLLRAQNPASLCKIKAIPGDVSELGLGLSPIDRHLLTDQVNIIYHAAASVRFDDSLTYSVIMNTRGTREVVKLALDVKNLDLLMHISTTYCNTNHKVIEERLYPSHADWEKTIEIVENIDKHTLNVLTKKYIDPLPNTYTFAKSLAEHVVYDMCKGKIPTVIYRPSIMISTALEPFPGWLDNLNGPVGLMVGSGKGVIRTVYSDPNIRADYIPIDISVKAMIMASWKQATFKDQEERLEPNFYNGSNNDVQPTTANEIVEMGKIICSEIPLDNVLWSPGGNVTNCYYNYFIRVIFYHLIPAMLVDGLLKVMGKDPMLVKIQRRIFVAMTALEYYSHNQWDFINEKCVKLPFELLPCDVEAFAYRDEEVEKFDYLKKAAFGARLYVLKEGEDLGPAKKHSYRMWVLSQIFNVLWYLGLVWILFVKIDVISIISNKVNDFVVYFTTD